MKVAVSYLKSKFDLNETIDRINSTDADYIHVDVMDGEFVSNKTYEYNELEGVLKKTSKDLDVHLMVNDPLKYIIKYKNLKPKIVTIHFEINKNISDLITLIHSYGIKVGISIKPNTSINMIKSILPLVDNVLIMSVEPGLGGQKFMDNIVSKIDELVRIRKESNYNYLISIDGGINDETIYKVKDVDFVISGSFICMSDNYQEKINSLRI